MLLAAGLSLGWSIALPIITLLVGAILGFVLSRMAFKRYLKKNPPINENMVRAMLGQMGRTPSEKQVRAIMKSMQENR